MSDQKKYLDQYDDGNPGKGLDDECRLSEEQISALEPLVGRILFNFNTLETELDWLIAEAINERSMQPGYAITAEFSAVFTKKILIFKSLYGPLISSISNIELEKTFNALCSSLFKLKDIRNDITHADWLGATTKYKVRLKIVADENGPYAMTRIMAPSYLQTIVKNLANCIESIETFTELKDAALASQQDDHR